MTRRPISTAWSAKRARPHRQPPHRRGVGRTWLASLRHGIEEARHRRERVPGVARDPSAGGARRRRTGVIRTTSSTRGIDGLVVDVQHGDIFDEQSVRWAMRGCDVVYYCVVDARPWLLDPTPMWRINVEGLRGVLDVAAEANLSRFVFTSSIGTIGRSTVGLADETSAHNSG